MDAAALGCEPGEWGWDAVVGGLRRGWRCGGRAKQNAGAGGAGVEGWQEVHSDTEEIEYAVQGIEKQRNRHDRCMRVVLLGYYHYSISFVTNLYREKQEANSSIVHRRKVLAWCKDVALVVFAAVIKVVAIDVTSVMKEP